MSDAIKNALKEFILTEFLPGEDPNELTETTPLITGGVLDSIATLKAALPQTQLLLVGGGPQEGLIKEKYRDLIKGGDVILTGRVPQDQVNKYYDAVDILVYPRHSMRLTELVTPLKPLEAMAKGKILLASDVGGHKELIKDKNTGILFKADDKEDLIEKIKTIAAMRESWNEISDRARSFVEKERNWGKSVAPYRDVYNRALAQFGRAT